MRGFTLPEVIITVTILAVTITTVMAWTLASLDRAELQTTAESIVGVTRSTQALAMSSRNNAAHGILLENDRYTTFIGDTYASSIVSSRQSFILPSGFQLSNITLNGGGDELVFQKASGETATSGSFDLTHDQITDNFTITITPLGLIDWN